MADVELMFLSSFSIEKRPDDIFDLIEFAILVGESKYPVQFEKRKNKIIKMLLYPDKRDFTDDEEEEEEDDTSTLDEEEDSVGDEDEVTNAEEKEEPEEDTQQITVPTIQKPSLKFRLKIKTSAPLEKHNNCIAMEGLKKKSETGLVDKQLDADKEATRQSHNTRMGSNKRNVATQVAPRPREIKLLSDFSLEEQLDGDKQVKKESHKGFRKMDSLTENKREEQKECTGGLTKSKLPPLMKMNNEATKHVQVTPNQQRLLSDFSPKKQINGSAITRPYQKNYFWHFDELSPNQNGFILAISLPDVLNQAISKLQKMVQA